MQRGEVVDSVLHETEQSAQDSASVLECCKEKTKTVLESIILKLSKFTETRQEELPLEQMVHEAEPPAQLSTSAQFDYSTPFSYSMDEKAYSHDYSTEAADENERLTASRTVTEACDIRVEQAAEDAISKAYDANMRGRTESELMQDSDSKNDVAVFKLLHGSAKWMMMYDTFVKTGRMYF
jgi:hypothetical protein